MYLYYYLGKLMISQEDIVELEFGDHSKSIEDDVTNMLDEKYEQINHARFEKYIGLNRIFVCVVLQILNPTKKVIMHDEERQKRRVFPILKNTMNVFHDKKNRVTRIRCNSIKKIE